MPVVVNGDIVDLASARAALEQSGADAVMLGRGAQGQPWAVGQIGAGLSGLDAEPAPRGAELAGLIAEHYEEMLVEYGTAVGLRAARKHLDWYMQAAGVALDKPSRNGFLNSDAPADVLRQIATIFHSEQRAAA